MKRKTRRENERQNTPDVLGQKLFDDDSHEHVFLIDQKGKRHVFTKKDHCKKILHLISKGWIVVSRPD